MAASISQRSIDFKKKDTESGASKVLRQATAKKGSPRFQMAKPAASGADSTAYSTITISPREALYSAGKLVTLRGRYGSRVFMVSIPAGIRDGDVIRLLGIAIPESEGHKKEDAYLRIHIFPDSDH